MKISDISIPPLAEWAYCYGYSRGGKCVQQLVLTQRICPNYKHTEQHHEFDYADLGALRMATESRR